MDVRYEPEQHEQRHRDPVHCGRGLQEKAHVKRIDLGKITIPSNSGRQKGTAETFAFPQCLCFIEIFLTCAATAQQRDPAHVRHGNGSVRNDRFPAEGEYDRFLDKSA